MRSADFIDTIGTGTHVAYTDSSYSFISRVLRDLRHLGITNVRDGLSDGANGSAPMSSYVALAQAGIKFTVATFAGGVLTDADLQHEINLIVELQQAVPGSVVAVEGPNEINNARVTYNGVGGLQGAVDLQAALYAAVHGNGALAGVPVDYFTGYAAGDIPAGPNPATTAGLADFDTQHPYPNFAQAPYAWVNRAVALGNEKPATGPAVYTETGYTTNQVNEDVQARYTLDLLFDTAQQGISRTYLYQLLDGYQPGSPQGDDGYGLFDPNNKPKAAATAVCNLTAILADTDAKNHSFTPTGIGYATRNLPTTGHTFAMQKSSGESDLAVWNEPQIWDNAKKVQVAAPVVNVTVSLNATMPEVCVFDPLQGTAAIRTLAKVRSVVLPITDHPLIVATRCKTPQKSGC